VRKRVMQGTYVFTQTITTLHLHPLQLKNPPATKTAPPKVLFRTVKELMRSFLKLVRVWLAVRKITLEDIWKGKYTYVYQ